MNQHAGRRVRALLQRFHEEEERAAQLRLVRAPAEGQLRLVGAGAAAGGGGTGAGGEGAEGWRRSLQGEVTAGAQLACLAAFAQHVLEAPGGADGDGEPDSEPTERDNMGVAASRM